MQHHEQNGMHSKVIGMLDKDETKKLRIKKTSM